MTHKTSDPNRFRSSYYGARYYIDPLPSCLVADATEERSEEHTSELQSPR